MILFFFGHFYIFLVILFFILVLASARNLLSYDTHKKDESSQENESSKIDFMEQNQWKQLVVTSWDENANSSIRTTDFEQSLKHLYVKNITDVVATDRAFAVRIARNIHEANRAYRKFSASRIALNAHNRSMANGGRTAAMWGIWGIIGYGGKVSIEAWDVLRNATSWPVEVETELTNENRYHLIYANDLCPMKDAFIALLNGTLSCWGNPNTCSGWKDVTGGHPSLKVERVLCGINGYVAIPLLNGKHPVYNASLSIIGNPEKGGKFPNKTDFTSTISNIGRRWPTRFVANSGAVALLLQGGTVIAWGDPMYGGVIPATVDPVFVNELYSNGIGFAAIKTTRKVISWGGFREQDIPKRIRDHEGTDQVLRIITSQECFLSMSENGSIATWGRGSLLFCNEEGAGVSDHFVPFLEVKDRLQSGVLNVVGNNFAFAAVKDDSRHTVVTWGHKDFGGTKTPCASCNWREADIRHAVPETLVATDTAFAFIREDGRGIAWGSQSEGGFYDVAYATRQVIKIGGSRKTFAATDRSEGLYRWQGSSQGYLQVNSTLKGFSLNYGPQHLFRTTLGFLLIEGYNCTYTEWHDWIQCDVPCGSGKRYRQRQMQNDALNGGCSYTFLENEVCHMKLCIPARRRAKISDITMGTWIGLACLSILAICVTIYVINTCCVKPKKALHI